MPAKRVISFIDGQNLYHSARQAFGYTYPNFDPVRLTQLVAAAAAWIVAGTRFYTGVPDQNDNRPWYEFWTAKCPGEVRRRYESAARRASTCVANPKTRGFGRVAAFGYLLG